MLPESYGGRRTKENTNLVWSEIDLSRPAIRLSPEQAKNDRSSVLPIYQPIAEILKRRQAVRCFDTIATRVSRKAAGHADRWLEDAPSMNKTVTRRPIA